MSDVFADTGYWVAILDPRDPLHERATVITEALGARRLVTTHMVLAEVLNLMRRPGFGGRERAWQLVHRLEGDADVEIIAQTEGRFRAAVERYAARPDQRWSLTDCASFLLMEERGIGEALAHDRDFEQAGFSALLRADPA